MKIQNLTCISSLSYPITLTLHDFVQLSAFAHPSPSARNAPPHPVTLDNELNFQLSSKYIYSMTTTTAA